MVERKKGTDEKFCSECGEIIRARAEICPHCGVRQFHPLNLAAVAPNGKSRLAALLFAFFLGSFGAHKFYLGRIGMGIFYLLLCWTGIPALLGVIEGVLLLVMSDEEFIRRYGGG
ncbi:MAG: hypothetical protein Fur0034_05880 [Desulfuromonadia bacterium]